MCRLRTAAIRVRSATSVSEKVHVEMMDEGLEIHVLIWSIHPTSYITDIPGNAARARRLPSVACDDGSSLRFLS